MTDDLDRLEELVTDTYSPPLGEQQVHDIERSVEWLVRALNDKDRRLNNASEAGMALAKAVYGYLERPPTVSAQELEAACHDLMQRHSGSFNV